MPKEKEVLFDVYQKGKESRRAHAILFFKEGHKISEIAKLFFVDEDTINNWIKRWNKEKTTEDKFRSGKPKKINSVIEQRICEIVDENKPEEHGFIATLGLQ